MEKFNYFEKLDSTYIIAEIGVNHNGDLEIAKKLIDEACICGANAVKFQSYDARKLASINTPKVPYQLLNSKNKDESHIEMLLKYQLSKDDHIVLQKYCIGKNIDFLSTPYDVDNAIFLNSLNIKMFKVASADIVDYQLHKYISSTKKPVIISTGMSTVDDIKKALSLYDIRQSSIILLHCVSNYPCSKLSINLKSIQYLKEYFDLPIGYSDHSSDSIASILSISFNAKIIEKHFTLDKEMLGPDHKASANKEELAELIKNIRAVELILGNYSKTIQKEELEMKRISRKSIYLKNDVFYNQIISENDVILQRPGVGINPMDFLNLIGKKYNKNLKKGELLKLDDII